MDVQERIEHLEHQVEVDRELIAVLEAQGLLDSEKIVGLETALSSCRRIGLAMGILMAAQKLTENDAFVRLRVASQHSHRKLRDVAEDVVLTGTLDVTVS